MVNLQPKKSKLQKLHRQFAHPPSYKIKDVLTDAKVDDAEMHVLMILQIHVICLKYKKVKPKPIVGFPLAKEFNETVAMDLKHWSGNTCLLHIIDHFTRFSASCVIHSKQKEVIVQKIFQIWIVTFGHPQSFLVDNGGEFATDEFITFCENLNIYIKTTAAESPWSNGLVERHNAVLGLTVEKTVVDSKCNLDTSVAWAVSAKNSLRNVNGFSPNQLVFGRNPNFPNVFDNKLPALECSTSSEIVASNISAMQSARKEYVRSEASEKRAMRHQVRTYSDVQYQISDIVYFRRNNDHKWRGPAKVIGIDGKQLLIKQGSGCIRVHACKVQHANQPEVVSNVHDQVEPAETVKPCDDDDDDLLVVKTAETSQASTNLDSEQSQEEEINPVTISDIDAVETVTVSQPEQTSSSKSSYSERKVHQYVQYKLKSDEWWKDAEVLSRGGKVGGKYQTWYNLRNTRDASVKAVGWHDVEDWKLLSQENEVYLSLEEICDSELAHSKLEELQKWCVNNVYETVEYSGQECVSVRWMNKVKILDGQRNVKSRLGRSWV